MEGKCPRNCEWRDPNYTPIIPFKQKSVLHISSGDENILILVETWMQALVLLLAGLEEEAKEKQDW